MTTLATTAPPAVTPQPVPTEQFVGRDFLRKEVQDFLALQNRLLLLVGPPNVGKTAFVQALTREHSSGVRPYLAHYCAENDGANPFVFCTNISAQLQQMLGNDFELSETARQQQVTINANVTTGSISAGGQVRALELHIGGMHPREAFRQLVREPLRHYNDKVNAQRDQQPLVILIDALDRAWEWDNGQSGNLISVLADAQDLPAWVSVIGTSRPGPAVQGLQARAGVKIVPIDPLSPENLADVKTFLTDCFIGQLDADDRSALDKAIRANTASSHGFDGFAEKVTSASQGSFLFVRRYVDTLRAALDPAKGADLAQLVDVDATPESLTHALDIGYEHVLASAQETINSDLNDADSDIMAALAIAYGPLSVAVINRITGCAPKDISSTLGRIDQLLAAHQPGDDRYSFYHSGFADFYRRTRLGEQTRTWNLRAAQQLEDGDNDQSVREYAAHYRWRHLQRGLRLTWANNPSGSFAVAAISSTPSTAAALLPTATVQAQVPQPVMQAQALRGLAAQALDTELANVAGSWSQALDYLRAAERTLRHSRALRIRSRQRYATSVPPEQVELERTMTAIGDTYVTIGQRMDPHIPTRTRPTNVLQFASSLWDMFARLPLTLFLLVVLAFQGAREVRLNAALQSLGRGQDWTVARLYVLAMIAYRRALLLASQRDDDEAADDITERLARLYTLMGAYDAAAAAYSALMARPAALARQWHQAVWRLELGEAQLANGRFNQAVDMFTSARLLFETQKTTVQLARTLSGLSHGYYWQAGVADTHGDPITATTLYNQSLATSEGAIDQWLLVAALPSTALGITDPQIAISAVCHKLWEASRDQRLDVEQQRRARTQLDRIDERHFPQRFEHPLLRLFRLGMAILLPAYLLIGLLLAVQLPSLIKVQTATDLVFEPPTVNLNAFPDNLLTASGAIPDVMTEDSLNRLTSGGARFTVADNWFSQDSFVNNTRLREISGDALVAVGLYYLSYLVIGLLIVAFASPEQFQIYRPGRIVLTRDALYWRGMPGQHPLLNVWSWLWRELSLLVRGTTGPQAALASQPWARPYMARIITFSHNQSQRVLNQRIDLPIAAIGAYITADVHILRTIVQDFSYTVLRPRSPGYPEITLDGRLAYYRELCDEIKHRLAAQAMPVSSGVAALSTRRRQAKPEYLKTYSIDLVHSGWGVLFCLMLGFTVLMLTLLRFWPDLTSQPIGQTDYSLSTLYVLIAPGLLLPLLWWFVAQPLGVWRERETLFIPLLLATGFGAFLAVAVVGSQLSLVNLGLKPDFALPTFAAGMLLIVANFARPHPFKFLFLGGWARVGGVALAAASLVGVVLLITHLLTTALWYDSVVRGNYYLEQTFTPECTPDSICPAQRRADFFYQRAISLNRNDSETNALYGQSALGKFDYATAQTQFDTAYQRALQSNDHSRAAIHLTNVATSQMLAARWEPVAASQLFGYTSALAKYREALGMVDQRFTNVAPTCDAMAQVLAAGSTDDASTPFVMRDPVPIASTDQQLMVRQLADTCLNLGLQQMSAMHNQLDIRANPAAEQAWRNLAGAVVGFRVVANSSDNTDDVQDALLGAAGTWLQLAQFPAPPAAMPDRRTAALMALRLYQDLQREQTGLTDPDTRKRQQNAVAGAAWSALQLGAWDTAIDDPATPTLKAATEASTDPTFPAINGLIRWFDSTQYVAPTRLTPSPNYTKAVTEAIGLYDLAIKRNLPNLDQAFALRSLMNYSLRNSRRSDAYNDADYGVWMQQAISDVDRAISEAETLQRGPSEKAGLYYWRGRLSLSLASTWQQRLRGSHSWNELMPLYARAYSDFSAATAIDSNTQRRSTYQRKWLPLAQVLLNDGTHFAFAQSALHSGDVAHTISELALIDPQAVKKLDPNSAAVPDYSYLYGLTRLAYGRDLPFANPFVKQRSQAYSTLASINQAISDTESGTYILKASNDNPFDSRALFYRDAITTLNQILTSGITLNHEDSRYAAHLRATFDAAITGGPRGGR